MTVTDFNKKWVNHIESRFEEQGLMISHHDVVKFLDLKFTELKNNNVEFQYSQIKWKFGSARIYIDGVDSKTISEWETTINEICK